MPSYAHYSSRIANASMSWQAACETDVSDWVKTNEFVIAMLAQTDAHSGDSSQFKLQWGTGQAPSSWNDLTGSGALVVGTDTSLVDQTSPVSSASGCGSLTDSDENEGDATTLMMDTTAKEQIVECQFAVDPSAASDGETYSFRLYDLTADVALGVAGASIIIFAATPYSGDVRLIGTVYASYNSQVRNIGTIYDLFNAQVRNIGTVLGSYASQVRNIGTVFDSYASQVRLIGTILGIAYSTSIRNIGTVLGSYSLQVRNIGTILSAGYSVSVRLIGTVYDSFAAQIRNIGTVFKSYTSQVRNIGSIYKSYSAQVRNGGVVFASFSGKVRNIGTVFGSYSSTVRQIGTVLGSYASKIRNIGTVTGGAPPVSEGGTAYFAKPFLKKPLPKLSFEALRVLRKYVRLLMEE